MYWCSRFDRIAVIEHICVLKFSWGNFSNSNNYRGWPKSVLNLIQAIKTFTAK